MEKELPTAECDENCIIVDDVCVLSKEPQANSGKSKYRGIRMFEGVEVGRSILEYRNRIAQKTHEKVVKIANSHLAKQTSVILAVALVAHCIYA